MARNAGSALFVVDRDRSQPRTGIWRRNLGSNKGKNGVHSTLLVVVVTVFFSSSSSSSPFESRVTLCEKVTLVCVNAMIDGTPSHCAVRPSSQCLLT
ncbi:hypothetical protein Cni_G24056 [Canna indica]|uniref:Uncharacterized protein n=1 Tax=Canna indica TaxID=4628 RepID=A0AAQ3KVH6_9LILI|nr:hypothetical protein Cni_G24056 [Canna indica]